MVSTNRLITLFITIVISSLIASCSSAAYNWSASTVDDKGCCGKYVSFSVLLDGRYCAAYFSNGSLRYAETYISNNKLKWHFMELDTNGITGLFTSIAVKDDDSVSIAYHDYTNRNLKIARRNGGTWSSSWSISIADDSDNAGTHPSIAVAPSGHEAIAYLSVSPGDGLISLKYALFNGTSWEIETVPFGSIDGDSDICLGFAPDGQPAIVYHQLLPSRPAYAKFNSATWTLQIPDNTIMGGRDPSLVFLTDGNPAVSYHVEYNPYEESFNDMRYAYFDGIDWHHEDVEFGEEEQDDLGYFSSMKLDPEGSPVIAYYQLGRTGVHYAYKEQGEWKVEVPQLMGLVGTYCSLIIDKENLPCISYYDMGFTRLRWARSAPQIRFTEIQIADDRTEDILLKFKGVPGYNYDMYYTDSATEEETVWTLAEENINPDQYWRDNGDSRTGNVHPSQVNMRQYRITALPDTGS